MKLKKSTFQVSKRLSILLNKKYQGQRTKKEERVTIRVEGRKKHTIKTQYMVNGEGTILLHKTGHDTGKNNA